MFNIKKQLTNTRPAKSTTPSIVTSPTKGTLRLSPSGADAMDIANGDYIAVIEADNGDGSAFYAVKGIAGVDGEPNFGSKLAGSNGKSSGTLQFSSTNTYNFLGGSADTTTEWSLDVENVVEHEGMSYFKLVKGETKAKMVKGKEAEDVEEIEEEA